MKKTLPLLAVVAVVFAIVALTRSPGTARATPEPSRALATKSAPFDLTIAQNAQTMMDEGRQTFRYETFGDEAFWSDGLGLDRAIEGDKNGGVGAGVSPKAALSLGYSFKFPTIGLALNDVLK